MLLSEWPNLDPLVVVVTKGGVPVAGETVSWSAAMDVNIGSGDAMTGDQSGKGIPYAGVRLTDGMDTTMPAPAGIACVGGTVLTDTTGLATCDVMLGSTPGTYAFSVAIGGFREYNELSVTIEP